MNKPAIQTSPIHPDSDEINLSEIASIIGENRALIALVTAAALTIGTGYAFLAPPV